MRVVFLTEPFFTASATVTVPFFCQTVRSVKRTEPLILTIRFLVFDREPYRTKNGHRFPFIIGDHEPHRPYRTNFGTVPCGYGYGQIRAPTVFK